MKAFAWYDDNAYDLKTVDFLVGIVNFYNEKCF